MTKKKFPKPKTARNKCPPEFRHEAVLPAAPVGVAEAADKLGIQTSQIYAWRRQAGGDSEAQQVLQTMQTENAKLKRLLAEREEDVAILKKGGGVLRESEQVKYAFMHANTLQFSVAAMCRNLGVARSGYYDRRKRPVSERQKESQSGKCEVGYVLTISREDYRQRHAFVWALQNEAVGQCGVRLLDPLPYLCDEQVCRSSVEGGRYVDMHHLSESGNRLLPPLFAPIFAGPVVEPATEHQEPAMPQLLKLWLHNVAYKNRRSVRTGNHLQLPASSAQRMKKVHIKLGGENNRLLIGQNVTLADWLADDGLFQAAKGLSRSEYGKYLLKLLEAGK